MASERANNGNQTSERIKHMNKATDDQTREREKTEPDKRRQARSHRDYGANDNRHKVSRGYSCWKRIPGGGYTEEGQEERIMVQDFAVQTN